MIILYLSVCYPLPILYISFTYPLAIRYLSFCDPILVSILFRFSVQLNKMQVDDYPLELSIHLVAQLTKLLHN